MRGYSILISFLFLLNVFLSAQTKPPPSGTRFYFLDVGQGDSELLILPQGGKILTDAGPASQIEQSLGKAIGNDHYIDLGIITHQQLDHFGGFNSLLKTHSFGTILFNGRTDRDIREWNSVVSLAKTNNIPMVAVQAGDLIRQGNSIIKIISPDGKLAQSGEWNDTGIVQLAKTNDFSVLLTADIDSKTENLLKSSNIKADVLKVAHHGSKTSSAESFLSSVQPILAGIEVGAKNQYHHPTPETLTRLKKLASSIYRTDENGNILITGGDKKLMIYTEK